MLKHLAQVNNTIPNLERNEHKCQTKNNNFLFGFFSLLSILYLDFSLFPVFLYLSLSPSFSSLPISASLSQAADLRPQ